MEKLLKIFFLGTKFMLKIMISMATGKLQQHNKCFKLIDNNIKEKSSKVTGKAITVRKWE